VPRDYKNVIDNSDQMFYAAFVKDVKVISHMINMRKRMAGIVDMDTSEGVESDCNEDQYPGNKEQYEHDVINQIDYIMGIINKRGGSILQMDVLDVVASASSLQGLRNKLCAFVAKHGLLSKQPLSKRQSSMSTNSERER